MAIAAVVIIVLLVILAPGLSLNLIIGRFKDAPNGFLEASAKDWKTWAVSLSIWALFGVIVLKKLRTRKATKQSGSLPKQKRQKRTAPQKVFTWWKVLKVSKDASAEEISRAYRDQIARSHPDKVQQLSQGIQKKAEVETKRLNAAYEEAKREIADIP